MILAPYYRRFELPWEDDPLRDFPNMREHFMSVWHKELQDLNGNYVTISGTGQDRYERAVKAIDDYLMSNFEFSISNF